MKAILTGKNRELLWEDVPDPAVGPEDVLIKVEAAALNRADVMQRAGDYPPPPGCPEWLGLEIAGTVIKLGAIAEKKSRWRAGDKVCALLGGGGYAQYVSAHYAMLMPVPKACSMAEAAAIPEAFATAYLNLFLEGKAKRGETLLMFGGDSGLASVVIPMAKAFGLRVITTVRQKERKMQIAHLCADRIIDLSAEDVAEVLREEAQSGSPVNIAIDCVGGAAMGKSLYHLAYGARWIMIAALAGNMTEIDLKNIYVRNIRIIGSTLRSRTPRVKAQILSQLVQKVFPKIENGQIKPTIYKTLPITEAEQAHAILERCENVGKVVLLVE